MNTIKIKGRLRLEVKDNEGNIKDYGWHNNVVTSAGKAQLALLAGDATAVPFTYLAVGTSATAAVIGDTALGAELTTLGLARSIATVSRVTTTVTNDTLRLVFTWTATGTTTVAEVGVLNASSGGTLLARRIPTAISLINGNQLTATYDVQFT